MAREFVTKNLSASLATTGTVSIKVHEKQELGGHGGVALYRGSVIAVLPKSSRKEPNRTEAALRTGELSL